MSADTAVGKLAAFVERGLAKVSAFRATADTVASGLVYLMRLGATAADGEGSARVAGFVIAPDDEVLCVPVAGKPVVLGPLQRAAPSDHRLDAPLLVTTTATIAGLFEQADGTDVVVVNTSSKIVEIANSALMKFWSGAVGAGSSLLVFDASNGVVSFGLAASNPSIRKGSGSPEGVVTAQPGSLFLSDNGNVYRKGSGSGNTGWVAT